MSQASIRCSNHSSIFKSPFYYETKLNSTSLTLFTAFNVLIITEAGTKVIVSYISLRYEKILRK